MSTVDEFSRSVDMGLRLSKRIYYGKDTPSMSAPKPPSMEKSLSTSSSTSSFRLPQNHHPTAPMVYAVVTEPVVVDNPDIRSYQPYVYGRCDPPALIPLHMVGVTLEVECWLDTAVVTVDGRWRVHCLSSTACCDCRIAVPMGEQEVKRQAGQVSFRHEDDVVKWSSQDFYFSYSVCSNEIFGGLLLQPPSLHDYDQRDMFCFYLFPGSNRIMKTFRKEVVFVIDISGSMRDDPLEKTKHEVVGSLWKLNQGDSFNILASNGDIKSFSSTLVCATEEAITNASEWMNINLIADGGTNLMLPLKQAVDMVGKTDQDSIPLIFLITDGTVEDERDICSMMEGHIVDGQLNSPRICTFGIGSYCNHYFLQMLANIGRGYYDSALDVDSISIRMRKLLDNATSPLLSNINLAALQNLESHEIFPFRLPDLLSGSPLIVSGRYKGKFPDIVEVRGFLADSSIHVIDVKVMKANDMPLEMVFATREIGTLTAQAWLEQSAELQEKVAKMSLQRGVPSEYTRMILIQQDNVKPTVESVLPEEKHMKSKNRKIKYMVNLNMGFGNLVATSENLPPGIEELKLREPTGKVLQAASSCWTIFLDRVCCRCFIQACAQLNDQCAIALTQLCTALACFQCLSWCCDMCDSCAELCLNCL